MKLLPIAIISTVLLVSACSDAPDTQSQTKSKAAPVAEASKTAQVAKVPKPSTVTEAPRPSMAATIPRYSSSSDEEKCEVDPVTGKTVCSSGLCGVFGGLCDQFPFNVMKIPPSIAFNIAKTVGSGALTAAKTGLETTEAGTAVVKTLSGAWRQVKRSIIDLLSDDPMEISNDTAVEPKKVASNNLD